jgi:2-methylcitrate dehydratase PrpD
MTEIQSITVYLYQEALDLLEYVKASTPYLAKFNIAFCVATAINSGHVDLDDFTDEKINNPEILRLMENISLQSNPELTRLYPKKWPSRVQIEFENGKKYEGYCEYPKGDPENPFSEKELIDKFDKLCENIITEDEKNRIIDLILTLEKLDDVTKIFNN